MTETQAVALARLRRLDRQADPNDLSEIYGELGPDQFSDDTDVLVRMVTGDELPLYVVGNREQVNGYESKFVADRVYTDLTAAKTYCDGRKNWEFDWVVMETKPGMDWVGWKEVHRTARG
jgi:hypothetical protein